MMTEEQKKQAAMELCRLRGIYPDKFEAGGLPAEIYIAWQSALEEIEAQEKLESAMQFGRNYKE